MGCEAIQEQRKEYRYARRKSKESMPINAIAPRTPIYNSQPFKWPRWFYTSLIGRCFWIRTRFWIDFSRQFSEMTRYNSSVQAYVMKFALAHFATIQRRFASELKERNKKDKNENAWDHRRCFKCNILLGKQRNIALGFYRG